MEILIQAPKQEPKEEKPVAKAASKAAGKKTKQPEAAKATQVADQVLADPVAEKLRQQRYLTIFLLLEFSFRVLVLHGRTPLPFPQSTHHTQATQCYLFIPRK